jgi:hypothetical protein
MMNGDLTSVFKQTNHQPIAFPRRAGTTSSSFFSFTGAVFSTANHGIPHTNMPTDQRIEYRFSSVEPKHDVLERATLF